MNVMKKLLAASIPVLICAVVFSQIGFAADSEYLVEYPLTGRPFNITVEAPDKVWFTMPDDNAVGFLDTTDPDAPHFVKYDLPNPDSEPYDIVYHNGFVWFTENNDSSIGRIDVNNGQIDEYNTPTEHSGPTGIDVAPNGLVWFLEQESNQLAKFDPSNHEFSEYLYKPPFWPFEAGLEDIVVVNNDEIWFTATADNEVGRYEPSRGLFASFSTRPPGSEVLFAKPVGITVDSTQTIWTTSFADSHIGRFAPGTLTFFSWFPTLFPAAGPTHIAFHDTGQRWHFFYSNYRAGSVSRLSALTSSAVTDTISHPLSSPDARPWGVDTDVNGCAWFALTGINSVAEWCIPERQQTWLPIIRNASS